MNAFDLFKNLKAIRIVILAIFCCTIPYIKMTQAQSGLPSYIAEKKEQVHSKKPVKKKSFLT